MKKKVCFVGFSLFSIGGAQRVTIRLANDLCEKYETHLLSICEIENKNNYFVNEKLKVTTLGMPCDMQARSSLKLFFKVKKFLKENKIDIVFIAGSLPVPLMVILKPFINSKIVFCDHENIKNRDKKSIFFRKLAVSISDKVVVLTKETVQDYIDKIGANKNKLVQIYNYLKDDLISKYGYCNINSKKIISVGRLSSEKGFDIAVDVAKEVFKKHSDWKWDIYGAGLEKEKILEKIKKLGLEENMFLKGEDSNVIEKYKDYSIYVLSSYREGFAVVLIEAKCNGLPIVSFNCSSGPSEIVENNVNGFLIPCYDKEAMADKICCLIENENLRNSFSQHSKDNLINFSKSAVLEKWIKLIEGV